MEKDIISSTANKQIRNIVKLQKKAKERVEQGCFVCEGCKMFEEARDGSSTEVIKVFLSENFVHSLEEKGSCIEQYAGSCEYEVIKDSIFSEVSQTVTPQGVLALVKSKLYNITDITKRKPARLLLLEDIQDPGNLGTLIRTAEAAGITGVIMSEGTADIYNPKVIRSTMGSIYRIPFMYTEDLCRTIKQLQSKGLSVYAAYLRDGKDYRKTDYSDEYAVVIGNEGNGLKKETAKAADVRIFIPMDGMVESLNAAIAGAILMFEMKHS